MSNEPIELPQGWVWTTLENLTLVPKSDIVDGPFGSNLKASEYLDHGIPIIRLQNIDRNLFIDKNIKFISYEKARLLGRHNFYKGDIVITKLGEPLGKACFIPEALEAGIIVADIVRIRTDEQNVSKNYLVYLINSQIVINQLQIQTKGTTRPRVNLDHVRKLSIPLPPLNEQRRIVAEIEALKARSQRVNEALAAIPLLLDQFRQSVLAAAFRGDLTADWRANNPDIEPASVLLERIRAERRRRWEEAELEKIKASGKKPTDDRWKEKYKEPELIDNSDLPELPDGWCRAAVELLSTKVVDGVHKKPNYVEAGIPFVTIKNLTAGSGISFDELNYISPEDHKEFFKRANPERGDILITKDGTLGVVRVIRTELVFSIFVSVALVKPVTYEMSDYLELAFSCPQMREQMLGVGIGLMHIHLKDLRRYVVPVAPLEEQQEIVHKIQTLFKAVDNINQQYQEAKAYLNQLDQSILAKAFRGELVPQDPNDEPASVLLERIQAERAKREAETKAAKKSTSKTPGQRGMKAKQQDSESIQLGLPGVE